MRDVKYRVWDLDENKMYKYYFGVDTKNPIVHLYGDDLDNIKENFRDRIKLMQYTGIKDKNGKEVYEGDVVDYFRGELAKIGFIAGSFVIDSSSHTETMFELMGELEVIGNIYENNQID